MPRRKKVDTGVQYFSPRLRQRLEGLAAAPLTYVEAPSGYGKTTAVHEMIFKNLPQEQVCWFTVLEDEELSAGWRRFCLLLAGLDAEVSQRLLALEVPEPKTLGAVAEGMRGLACGAERYIVVDNFQHWAEQFPRGFVELWAGLPGHGLHVVLVTQPLPGSVKMLASRDVLFVGQDWFTLDEGEIRAYFAKAGIAVPAEQALAIYQKTEG